MDIDEFSKIYNNWFEVPDELQNAIQTLKDGKLLEDIDLSLLQQPYSIMVRTTNIAHIGCVTPTLKWASALKAYVIRDKKVLEVMAGRGVVAQHLASVGVDIKSTDDGSWYPDKPCWAATVYPVEVIDAVQAVEKYGADVDFLLICWAPYDDPIAYRTAKKFFEINPAGRIIFIGEVGGCTADDDYFQLVETADEYEIDEVNAYYPQWTGIWDFVMIHKLADYSKYHR